MGFSVTEEDRGGGLSVEVTAGVDTQSGYRQETLTSYTVTNTAELLDLVPLRIGPDFKHAIQVAMGSCPRT